MALKRAETVPVECHEEVAFTSSHSVEFDTGNAPGDDEFDEIIPKGVGIILDQSDSRPQDLTQVVFAVSEEGLEAEAQSTPQPEEMLGRTRSSRSLELSQVESWLDIAADAVLIETVVALCLWLRKS